jgi:hypothetical protein
VLLDLGGAWIERHRVIERPAAGSNVLELGSVGKMVITSKKVVRLSCSEDNEV